MIQADTFVGTLAILLSAGIGYSAVTAETLPTQLQVFREIERRYGRSSARVAVMLVAGLVLLAGLMILGDLRPGYASSVGAPYDASDERVTAGSN